MTKLFVGAVLSAAVVVGLSAQAQAVVIIPTNLGVGADAEVRAFQPDSNRGASNELATRIRDAFPADDPNDSGDRGSKMYVRFDISQLSPATIDAFTHATIRLTTRNANQITQGRVVQTVDGVTKRAGLQYHALNVGHQGESWDELGITFNNAPGLLPGLDPDRGIGVHRFDPNQTMFMGIQQFSDVAPQNWMPVGGAFDFSSAMLLMHVREAVKAGQDSVTFIMATFHDGDPAFTNLVNFNYLFNPKEMTTLNNDPNYNPNPDIFEIAPGSPWSLADNSTGLFSPQLILIPEPSSLALLGLGGLAMIRRRRR